MNFLQSTVKFMQHDNRYVCMSLYSNVTSVIESVKAIETGPAGPDQG